MWSSRYILRRAKAVISEFTTQLKHINLLIKMDGDRSTDRGKSKQKNKFYSFIFHSWATERVVILFFDCSRQAAISRGVFREGRVNGHVLVGLGSVFVFFETFLSQEICRTCVIITSINHHAWERTLYHNNQYYYVYNPSLSINKTIFCFLL